MLREVTQNLTSKFQYGYFQSDILWDPIARRYEAVPLSDIRYFEGPHSLELKVKEVAYQQMSVMRDIPLSATNIAG